MGKGFTVFLHGAYNGHGGLSHLLKRFLARKQHIIPLCLKHIPKPSSSDILSHPRSIGWGSTTSIAASFARAVRKAMLVIFTLKDAPIDTMC